MFEHQSINIVFLLWQYFDHLTITKPAISKPESSEVYITAKGFRGVSAGVQEKLLAHVTLRVFLRNSHGNNWYHLCH
jgi:hypothetical protein